jgi:hypothetical protein
MEVVNGQGHILEVWMHSNQTAVCGAFDRGAINRPQAIDGTVWRGPRAPRERRRCSSCQTSDFGSKRCAVRQQPGGASSYSASSGIGILVLIRQARSVGSLF